MELLKSINGWDLPHVYSLITFDGSLLILFKLPEADHKS